MALVEDELSSILVDPVFVGGGVREREEGENDRCDSAINEDHGSGVRKKVV
jgi:hypothetical protein